jgi:hypothetical protein
VTDQDLARADLKARLAATVADLQREGVHDREAMWLMASLASDLAGNLGATSWTEAKSRLTPATYDVLLEKFRTEGNAAAKAGRQRHAYAIQALVLSIIAHVHGDEDTRDGMALLDRLIDTAVARYRETNRPS